MGIGAFRIWIPSHSPRMPKGLRMACLLLSLLFFLSHSFPVIFLFLVPESPLGFFAPLLTLISSLLIFFFVLFITLAMVSYQISMFWAVRDVDVQYITVTSRYPPPIPRSPSRSLSYSSFSCSLISSYLQPGIAISRFCGILRVMYGRSIWLLGGVSGPFNVAFLMFQFPILTISVPYVN